MNTTRLVIGHGDNDNADNEEFGRLLRRLRGARSVRQEIASPLGVSPGYIRAVERGDRSPSPAIAVDLLGLLGVEVERQEGGIAFELGDRRWEIVFRYWNGDSWRTQNWRRPQRSSSDHDLFGQLVRKLAAMDEEQLRLLAGILLG